MDLYRIIRELVQERDRLQRIIDSLEEMKSFGRVPPAASEGKRRGRKSMDPAARVEVSERMTRYWAQRKAKEGARQKERAPVGSD
ncbi:MAG TPA: hypothetical protein VHZ74_22055 [Bryobacteraceae bacterium]|jgi:hypothetical protein|nr:hypothetical protein [Bryobacteraceae bacterium]